MSEITHGLDRPGPIESPALTDVGAAATPPGSPNQRATPTGDPTQARDRLRQFIAERAEAPDQPLDRDRARRALKCAALCITPELPRADILVGWDPDRRALFDDVAASSPELLEQARADFSQLVIDVDSSAWHALQQLDFALAVVGKGPWPERTMTAIARLFLNSPPSMFAYEGKIPGEILSEAAVRLLSHESVPLLQWSRIEWLIACSTHDISDQLRRFAILNYCGVDFRSRAIELTNGAADDFLELLRRGLEGKRASPAGTIAASLALTRALGQQWGATVPEAVRRGLRWDLGSGNLTEASVSLDAYRQLDSRVATALLSECIREERAVSLVPALKDASVIDDLIGQLQKSDEVNSVVVDALTACGELAADRLAAACEAGKVTTSMALVATEVFLRLESHHSVLVTLLGHTSKRVASAASRALEKSGRSAEAALCHGANSKKRVVREHAARLLEKLSEHPSNIVTPLGSIAAKAEQLTLSEREHFSAHWRKFADEHLESAHPSNQASWETELKPLVRRFGAVALELLRNWFLERLESGETRMWCFAVEELREDPDAVWVAVDTFARMPKVASSLWARPRGALGRCQALLVDPISYCLRSVQTDYREVLFGLLAANADNVAPQLFVGGLSDPSKVVRTHSVDGLSRVPEPPVADVAELLSSPEPGTRTAAAELLAVWGSSDALTVIVAAWFSETRRAVRTYLEDTLVACGRGDLVYGCKEGAPADRAAAERFLAAQTPPKDLPSFVVEEDLPSLRFVDGTNATPAVRQGLLARLTKLDTTHKGRALKPLLPLFDLRDLNAWGRALYERWWHTRSPKLKWAILQLSLLADDELLSEALAAIPQWRGREHAIVGHHLRAAQWHGSEVATQWLGYWSENLAPLGGRSVARQLFGRVAFKRSCSPQELRSKINPFLHEERIEHELTVEATQRTSEELDQPPEPQLTTYGLSELQRSWLTGREWSAESLGNWLALIGPAVDSLLFITQDQVLCRLTREQLGGVSQRPTLRQLDDRAIEPDARVRLLHPLDLAETQLALLRDAATQVAPFPQLEREIFRPSDIANLLGREVPSQHFVRWRRGHRWFHGEPMDGGMVYSDSLHLLARDVVVTLQHSGVAIADRETADSVTLLSFDFTTLDGAPLEAEALPSVVYSELHRSMLQLLDGGD